MPQPRAPKIDWLLEAWNLSTTLTDVPTRPLKLGSLGRVPLDESVESYLASLQTRINGFLNYCVAMKFGARQAKMLARFDGDDSRHLIATRNALKKQGMDFDERATAAIFVHAQIGFIRHHWYLDEPNRITLPVTLVAVAGKSAGLKNAVAAGKKRRTDRRGPITKLVERARRHDPDATCLEVLDRICDGDANDRETVKGVKDGRLHYRNAKGKLVSMGLDRFENIFSQQRPSTG